MTHTDLPPDFRLAVFKHVEDLAFLRNLIRASPSANTSFSEAPVEVFSHVVGKSPKELQQIIHANAASVCSPSLDIPMIEEPILFNREDSYNTTTEVEDNLPPISFDLPVSLLKQLLELAHRIQLLTTLFIKTHIKRLNNLTPQHLAKPGFVFSSSPFRKYPDGKKYKTVRSGPASWVEEYRVVRALWRLQLFCLLTKPNTRVTAHTNEEAVYIECSLPYRQHEFSKILSHLTKWEIDEMLSVQDYLDSARISLRAPPSTPHDNDNSSVSTTNSSQTPSSPSTPSPSSATAPPPTFPNPATSRSSDPPSPFQKHHDLIAIKRSTEAYNFFHRYGLRQPTSPLQRSHWINFRRLGFGFWDQERMCQMELFRMPAAIRDQAGGKDLSIDDVAFTWKSVEAAGEKEGKEVIMLEELNGKLGGLRLNDSKNGYKVGSGRREEKGYTGLKGLMRSKTKSLGNGTASDGSSPRTSGESFRIMSR